MKKIVLTCGLIVTFLSTYSMMKDELSVEEVAKRSGCFGDAAHFIDAIKDLSSPVADKLAIVRTIMENQDYAVCFNRCFEYCYEVYLYKQYAKDVYSQVGVSLFDQVDDSKFCIKFLRVESNKRGQGLGTVLFLYTIHAARHLSYEYPMCRLTWQACPLEVVTTRDSQTRLNRFYLGLGGKLIDEEHNEFEWTGPSLQPFKLQECASGAK